MNREINFLENVRYLLARIIKKLNLAAIRRSVIYPISKVEHDSQVVGGNLEQRSYCGRDCFFLNLDVGKFCSISDKVVVGGSSHRMHFVSTSPDFLSDQDSVKTKFAKFDFLDLPKSITGHNVWIGCGTRIRAGVNIGHGAVVAMGSVATRDVAPHSNVGGNPAKSIKKRFEEMVIEVLLKTHRWRFPEQNLKYCKKCFDSSGKFARKWNEQ
jgi:acetyltransferase-like isoleucine patch superfamily enzyme